MLSYFNSIEVNKFIYSCDNIRISCSVRLRFLDTFRDYWCRLRPDITIYPERNKPFTYRNLVTILYDKDVSMTLGIGFIGANKIHNESVFIDFNPNKVCHYKQFWDDYSAIKGCCIGFNLVRCDIALDIPCMRSDVILVKDSRKYQLNLNSAQNKTEYLGQRSSVGFVKVYNKQVESCLDSPLTRIEVTCSSFDDYMQHFPTVYLMPYFQEGFNDLTDTQRFILYSAFELQVNNIDPCLSSFKTLGRKTREKLEPYLIPEECKLFPSDCVKQLFIWISAKFT